VTNVVLREDRCKSCGARVYWLPNDRTRKWAPIDVKVNPKGNIIIENGQYVVVSHPRVVQDKERHTNHFVSCPQADKWHGGSSR
jgi:hypothetical protein